MKILVDEEGGKLVSGLMHKGMKEGAFGAEDVQALFTIQATMKMLPKERKKRNEDEDETVADKTTDQDTKREAGDDDQGSTA